MSEAVALNSVPDTVYCEVFVVFVAPGLQVMDGRWLSFTFTLNEQVLVSKPLVAFHLTVVRPLFNCTPASEVPVPDVAPLKVYDKVVTPQLVAVALNSLPEIVYLHVAPAFLVHGLPEGQVITGALDVTEMDFDAYFEPQLLVTVYLIVAVPEAMPLTTPPDVTVATVVLLLLQVPGILLPLMVNGVVEPMQTVDAQLIVPAFGSLFTVTVKLQVLVLPQASLAV